MKNPNLKFAFFFAVNPKTRTVRIANRPNFGLDVFGCSDPLPMHVLNDLPKVAEARRRQFGAYDYESCGWLFLPFSHELKILSRRSYYLATLKRFAFSHFEQRFGVIVKNFFVSIEECTHFSRFNGKP